VTLDEMLTLAETQARTVMIGTQEELTPVWLMLGWDGNVEIVATPWFNDEQKHLVIEAMRLLMREKQVSAYSFLTEAWMARISGKEAGKEYKGPPPSQRADRQEAVVVMAANRAGEHRYRNYETVRDKRGRCTELRRLGGAEDRISSYIFDNLLDDKRRAN
jgi:hypothetical protein